MNFGMVVQARESFSSYILDMIGKINLSGISWQGVASRSDQETIELIETFGRRSDVLAVFGKNSEPVNAALAPLRSAGIHVLAFLSDLDPAVRSSYIGGDNRAGGQLAGFLVGRRLQRESAPAVALVTSRLGYRAWEDREIGFRSLLGSRFPRVRVFELVQEKASPGAAPDLATALAGGSQISAIYNVTGENETLTEVLLEIPATQRPLYITHELDRASEPLLRSGVIDFLIVQKFENAMSNVSRILFDALTGSAQPVKTDLVPTQLLSRFNPEP